MAHWECSLCEDSPEFDSQWDAQDHVEENHLESLITVSVERIEEEDKLGSEPIDYER